MLTLTEMLITILYVDVIMPPAINKRGHPKEHEVTVIGLPTEKRKENTSEPCKLRLQPFIKLHTSIKEIYLLINKTHWGITLM